ncbi:unnamed protein product [Ceutorhynchus assimilis]|uniref:Peptidase S1 domain-containing protein n=1 Tax=Ceutorhynchus assimilis TaxID=467358 RepID=A0A9N9MVD0_9CUCU|nr:unnamed protein product [Ceutorhynchus assimilis]
MVKNCLYVIIFLIVNFYKLNSAKTENTILERKIPEIRIINGYTCSTNDYPFVVKIKLGYTAKKSVTSCGGTLIRPKWVLSAAHCFSSKDVPKGVDFWIEAGCDNLQSGQTVEVETFYIHLKYKESNAINDIAIVKLRDPIVHVDGIGYATLPRRNDSICSKAVVMGWGLTSNNLNPNQALSISLQCGSVEIIDKSKCLEISREISINFDFDKHSQICTFSRKQKAEARQGDSGGPLLCGDVQVGIVSFKTVIDPNNMDIESPVVYTRVQYFLDFINDTIENSGTMHSRSILMVFIIFLRLLHNISVCH